MEQATAGQDSGPAEDWRGRALAAEAERDQLRKQLHVIKVVVDTYAD